MHATHSTVPTTIVGLGRKSILASPAEPAPSGESRILIVDAGRRLIRASEAGARMLREETALRLVMGRVQGAGQVDEALLSRAVALAARGDALEPGLPLGPKGVGLSLSVVALLAEDGGLEVMLLVRDGREERRRALARAAAFFGFTTAEQRLVTALYEGCSVPDAAGRLGVAPTTARSHLQSVFAKTGVRRQGDLLALLSSAPTPVRAFA